MSTSAYLKRTIFWDMTPCSLLKVNRRFGGTYRLHLQGRRIRRASNQRESRRQAEQGWFLARLILRPWRWRQYVTPKRRLTFTGLHGVISQKIVLFITTALRTSNPSSTYLIIRVVPSSILTLTVRAVPRVMRVWVPQQTWICWTDESLTTAALYPTAGYQKAGNGLSFRVESDVCSSRTSWRQFGSRRYGAKGAQWWGQYSPENVRVRHRRRRSCP
jgi:hypothetical protein